MDSINNGTPPEVQFNSVLNKFNESGNLTPSTRNCSYKRSMPSPSSQAGPSLNSCSVPTATTLAQNLLNTPPAKRFHRVRNPFEAALAERLHLPLIGSPSLFHRPATPQLSSTQFEWTIDEVSSLIPVNVEPHETQFHDSPDPDLEAKAQSAISSYFKENKIVPSPVDCPLRKQRIILSELNGSTPITKQGRHNRDVGVQTELSLPFCLPKDLEDALRPYMKTHLSDQNDRMSSCSSGADVKDVSLRRKLFDIHNVIVLDENQLSMSKSETINVDQAHVTMQQHKPIIGKLSDSMDKSSIGSLSPLSAADGLSISSNSSESSYTRCRQKMQHFLNDFEEMEQLSPIHPSDSNMDAMANNRNALKSSITDRLAKEKYRTQANISEQNFTNLSVIDENKLNFSAERSSSPIQCQNVVTEVANEFSFNMKVSRLAVTGTGTESSEEGSKHSLDTEILLSNGHEDHCNAPDISISSTYSSSSDTPRSKPRSANRKNLSQSFSAVEWSENEDYSFEMFPIQTLEIDKVEQSTNNVPALNICTTNTGTQSSTFYRTDSGFNEMTCSLGLHQDDSRDVLVKNSVNDNQPSQGIEDVTMGCCSTPSK